ncbi:hypothetical protein ACGLWX_12145 [Halomonas sp. HMF6819]|uniref:hypothetical protein n=1 Tax=Halomonas sp. HMF6819 TaxID=3373085 RepID=UPI003790300A
MMPSEPKLRVAPPRQRNPQLSQDGGATFEASRATDNATGDLKSLANSYLQRKERNQQRNHDATEDPKTAQLSGNFEGVKVAQFADVSTYSEEVPDWLEWIAQRCPLVPEDRRHVVAGLLRLHPRMQQRLAERYVEAWRAAADDEPMYHKRDNAGRRAANLIITKLKRGAEYV